MSDEANKVMCSIPVPMTAIEHALERAVTMAVGRDRVVDQAIQAAVRTELESPAFRELIRKIIADLVQTGGLGIAQRYVKRHQDRLFGDYANEMPAGERE